LRQEHNAQAYGLFCSTQLTPSAMNRLELKKDKSNIKYWTKLEIENELSQIPDLIIKYRLT